jgi:hypothetical protein
MTKYIIGVVTLLIIGGGAWWYTQQKEKPIAIPSSGISASNLVEKPWVEVVTTTATVVSAQGTTATLYTGDEVAVGSSIKTDTNGVVVVHFSDGSFAKLDPNSSITITEASYEESSGSSNVHVTLNTGTLWSKVLDLVGINSSWQVETSNAVATVRGTSFMTSMTKGKTKVVGIENKVAVIPLRLDTHKPIGIETVVTSDVQTVIDETHIDALASGKEQLATTTMSSDILASNAYKEFKNREEQFNATRDSLRTKFGESPEFRKEFRDAQVKDFEQKILERRELNTPPTVDQIKVTPAENATTDSITKKTENPTNPPKTNVKSVVEKTSSEATTPAPQPKTGAKTTGEKTTESTTIVPANKIENPVPNVHPVSLSITSERDLSGGITDGETAVFHAILILSDNSKKDVTDSVKWNVINKIGVFSAPGKLEAQLPPDYAELGVVTGAVYATFNGPDGKELNAASKAFDVHSYIPSDTNTQG